MNSKKNILLSLLAASAVAGVVIYLMGKLKTKKRLTEISNEGYETAHDVLYPLKFNRKYKWTKEGSES